MSGPVFAFRVRLYYDRTTVWSPHVPPTPASAVYGLALAALVYSHVWTYAVLELFIAPGWTLGTHEQDWTAWHAMGCANLGLLNALCWRDGDWNASARRALTLSSGFLFAAWGVQNFSFMLATPARFTP